MSNPGEQHHPSPPLSEEGDDDTMVLRKLGVVCRIVQDPEDSYDIYITEPCHQQQQQQCGADDPAAMGFMPRRPSLRLDGACFRAEAFCSFRSMLYMFQGFPSSPEGRSVASFDLSKLDLRQFDVKLEPSMLAITHRGLLHPKVSPSAIATPDGRIVVFSNNIMCGSGNVDFELYDPFFKSSRVLPGLPEAALKRGDPCWILGYTIYGKSTLFLQTQAGMFSLDFDLPVPQWEHPDLFYGSGKIVGCAGPFYIIRDELCLAPLGTHDIKDKQGFRLCANFPTCFPGVKVFRRRSWSVIPLLNSVADGEFSYCLDNGDLYFCVVQTAVKIDEFAYSEPILMSIDVRHCNLNEFRESVEASGGSQPLRSSIINSFKFRLDAGKDSSFKAYDLFTF